MKKRLLFIRLLDLPRIYIFACKVGLGAKSPDTFSTINILPFHRFWVLNAAVVHHHIDLSTILSDHHRSQSDHDPDCRTINHIIVTMAITNIIISDDCDWGLWWSSNDKVQPWRRLPWTSTSAVTRCECGVTTTSNRRKAPTAAPIFPIQSAVTIISHAHGTVRSRPLQLSFTVTTSSLLSWPRHFLF